MRWPPSSAMSRRRWGSNRSKPWARCTAQPLAVGQFLTQLAKNDISCVPSASMNQTHGMVHRMNPYPGMVFRVLSIVSIPNSSKCGFTGPQPALSADWNQEIA